jgi:hypothetical protein
VFVAVVIVSVSSGRVFGNQIAWLLGAFATLACFFALVCLLANGSSSRQTRGLRADWAFGDLKPSRLRAGRAPTWRPRDSPVALSEVGTARGLELVEVDAALLDSLREQEGPPALERHGGIRRTLGGREAERRKGRQPGGTREPALLLVPSELAAE